MSIEADIPLLGTNGTPQVPARRISPTERLDWIFDAPAAATVVEIRGDRWTGKSTLLTRLCDEASLRNWTVASGNAATQPLRGVPLGLFVDALDDLLSRSAPGSADGPDGRTGRPDLFPALCADGPQPLPSDPFSRYQAFRSVRTLLESLSPSGLLLALDDVHRADEASLALLSYLLRNPPGSRVVLALAHRPRQVAPALRSLLDQTVARGRAHCLSPAGLTAEHALALLPHDLSRVQCERILDRSGRNPGLLKALGASPSTFGPGGSGLPALPLDVLTETLRDFEELSETAWRVMRAAAVLDEPFDAAALRAVAQVSDEELCGALDELTREDLLRADGFSARLRFSEPLLGVTAYQSAGPGWLRGAHARAALLLSARGAEAVQLAGHLERSPVLGERESARVLVRAARARLWHDPVRTAAWAGAALDLELPDCDKAGARLLAGAALTLCGRLKDAVEALAPLSAGPEIPEDLRADAGHWRARALGLLGARRAAERELADVLASSGSDVERHALLLGTRLACALDTAGPVPEDLVAPLLTVAERLGPAARGRVLALCAAAAVRSRAGAHADFHVTAAGRLLDRGVDDDVAPHLDGLFWLARAESRLGRHDAAHRHLERGLRIVEHRRLRVLVPRFAMALGELDQRRGDLPAAARHAASAEVSAAATDSGYLLAAARSFRAALGRPPASPSAEGLAPGGGAAAAAAPEALARPVPAPSAHGGLRVLSKREMEIAVLVSGGRTNQQIARSLEVSHKTVETHLGRIFKKLQVSSRAEVAAMVGRSVRGVEATR